MIAIRKEERGKKTGWSSQREQFMLAEFTAGLQHPVFGGTRESGDLVSQLYSVGLDLSTLSFLSFFKLPKMGEFACDPVNHKQVGCTAMLLSPFSGFCLTYGLPLLIHFGSRCVSLCFIAIICVFGWISLISSERGVSSIQPHCLSTIRRFLMAQNILFCRLIL